MKVLERRVFRGPNRYATWPVIRLTLDLEVLEHWPSDRLAGFNRRLLAKVPTLRDHGCCYGEPGGFVRRLERGTWMGHILEHVALELQNLVGADVCFGKTRGTGTDGIYHVVYSYEDEAVGLRAAEIAMRLLEDCLPPEIAPVDADEAVDVQEELQALRRLARRRALGPSTAAIVKAAEARGIPWTRLDHGSYVLLGTGRWQRRVEGTLTDGSSSIAVDIASDKERTNQVLAEVDLPVPDQRTVHSAEEALRAAEAIGWPVVVKPLDGNHGRAVTVGVEDPAALQEAFRRAAQLHPAVLVEQLVPGEDHRLLVVGGRMVAAARRVPGHVIGDGEHTVEELVALTNQDPRRGEGHGTPLTRLVVDDAALRCLARDRRTVHDVPKPGERVALRETANLSTGGTAEDVTDEVHPDNRELAERAALAVGLDVAGIDFLTRDIRRSWREVGGAICEVNAAPGLRMHLHPSVGAPRDVAGPIVDLLFPADRPRRVPVLALTGTNGKTTTARMIAHIQALAGHTVGLASTDGIYLAGRRIVDGDTTGPDSARLVLRDPRVEVAVLEVARGGILRAGMGVDRVDVGAVLNVGADHLGFDGVETLEDMAFVKRLVVDVAREVAVLSADDPRTAAMAEHTRARAVCWVTADPADPRVREHVAGGGRAVVLERGAGGETVVLHHERRSTPLITVGEMPATLGGAARHNVLNAMFAAAVTWSAGTPVPQIREGLAGFACDFDTAPGRLNLYDGLPFRVVMDYGHNAPAFRAVCSTVDRMGPAGRRIVVLVAPGNRRDEDIRAAAREAAPFFDHFICRRDDDPRGRAHDEVPRLLREGLRQAGVPTDRIELVPSERDATARALSLGEPGGVVVLFAENLARTWGQVRSFRYDDGEGEPALVPQGDQPPGDRRAPDSEETPLEDWPPPLAHTGDR